MWIKICGVRDPNLVPMLRRAEPDAIGLNFHPPSKRFVDVEIAKEIVTNLPHSITPVGLFVNRTVGEVHEICKAVDLQTIQLHGDETPEFAAELSDYKIIRAFRIGGESDFEDVSEQLDRYRKLGVELLGCLVDARVSGEYGGTGHRAPWDLLTQFWNYDEWPHLILAGGLAPENVGEAIDAVRPWGVDVASGVESAPGTQDPQKISSFIVNSRTTR